jgi:hypothetical protein
MIKIPLFDDFEDYDVYIKAVTIHVAQRTIIECKKFIADNAVIVPEVATDEKLKQCASWIKYKWTLQAIYNNNAKHRNHARNRSIKQLKKWQVILAGYGVKEVIADYD